MKTLKKTLALIFFSVIASSASAWVSEGPNSISGGQVTGINNGLVIGDINQVLVNPIVSGGAITAYASSVNGGVWSTTDLLASNVSWTPLTDFQSSLSVGAMSFDSSDTSYKTIVYGAGEFSNGKVSGPLNGIFRSSDSGLTWSNIGVSSFSGASISSLYANGSDYVVGVNKIVSGTNTAGLYYSTNGGSSFSLASGTSDGQLPQGGVTAITVDPNNSQRFYAGVLGGGVYVSTNGGVSWGSTTLPDVPMMTNAGITINPNTNNDNIRIVAQNYGGSTVLYAGVSTAQQASGFFRSTDGGSNWQSMSIPTTLESGIVTGLNPGNQGDVNFTLIASPTNPNVIYVGGDSQPPPNPNFPDVNPSSTNPNSSGAVDWTARLFQGTFDTGNTNTTWTPITDNFARTNQLATNGVGGTAPHADSRSFAFLPDGSLIETDDAGIYLRSTPTLLTGTWTSLNGNLSVTEINRIAYDINSGILISGNQDTGAPMQHNSTNWSSILTADGGDVAVDNISRAASNQSIRYMQNQYLSPFLREVYDASNNRVTQEYVAGNVTSVTGGGAPAYTNLTGTNGYYGQGKSEFYPHITVNSVAIGTNPGTSSLALGGTPYLLTSQDGGDTVKQLNVTPYSNNIVDLTYGGIHNGVTNANALWAVTAKQVILAEDNTTEPRIVLNSITNLTTNNESFIALAKNPKDYYTLAIASQSHVWLTMNSATNFTDLTGNLFSNPLQSISTLAYLSGSTGDALLVGGSGGLYYSLLGNDLATSTNWYSLSTLGGNAIPNAYISELLYIPGTTDTIFASTMGRGAWSLGNASALIGVPEPSTYILLGLGGLALAAAYRRRV